MGFLAGLAGNALGGLFGGGGGGGTTVGDLTGATQDYTNQSTALTKQSMANALQNQKNQLAMQVLDDQVKLEGTMKSIEKDANA